MPTPDADRLLSSPVSCARLVRDLISAPDARVGRERVTRWVAVLSGVTFIIAGLVKFVFHHWELHAFRSFGLPWPAALEIFAGVLETVGGILLVRRRAVVPAAGLLGFTMVVAIISSGIGHGDVIPSLTLAPALLLATMFLVVRGLGLGGTRRM
jgi:putative oxidoreductase